MQFDLAKGSGVRPFLSWAGSKRKLIRHLAPYIPEKWETYYEPFLGGGAMFFHLSPPKAVISDASSALVATYKAIKRDHVAVAKFLSPLRPSRAQFDRTKQQVLRSDASKAGQFIFLNKACWNGLYRVNSDGVFNVPYGRPRSDFVFHKENLDRCGALLRKRNVSIKHQDFSKIEDQVKSGDFVFLDPPYVTSHNMNGFVDWNEKLFSWADQIRLAKLARKFVEIGANVLITNADHEDVHALYLDFGYHRILRSSTLASDTRKRGRTSEAVFFGGPAYSGGSQAKRGTDSHDSECRTG